MAGWNRCTPFVATTPCADWPTNRSTCSSSGVASPAPASPWTRRAGGCARPWSRRATSPRAPRRSPPKWSTGVSATSSRRSSVSSTRTWPSASASSTTRPHLVSPLPFLIPLFGKDGVVSSRPSPAPTRAPCGSTTSRAAGASASATGRSTSNEALAHLPTLNTDHLVAGFLYFDARADDARLTLTLARTAALEFGAAVANYTPVVSMTDGDRRQGQRGRGAPGRGRPGLGVSRSGPRWWSTPPVCGPTAYGPWTRAARPTPSARPRACT